MSKRDTYPPGVPCWVDTGQPDPRASVDFYGDVFGWEFVGPGRMPGEPPGEYFVARLRGVDVAGVGSQPAAGAPPAPAWSTYISVESADAAATSARSANGTVVVEPFDAPPAGRMAVLADPSGAAFCAWEADERVGAGIVNEPGAWSMSTLNTPDPEGCTAFYGAMFGWEPDAFELGGAQIPLFRLPGFVGGEPRQPVPRDVVAVMAPMSGDPAPADVPAHWGVDFWVDDPDGVAERVVEGGGEVVVPPFDTPVFRGAVLADPEGAVFSVSKVAAAG